MTSNPIERDTRTPAHMMHEIKTLRGWTTKYRNAIEFWKTEAKRMGSRADYNLKLSIPIVPKVEQVQQITLNISIDDFERLATEGVNHDKIVADIFAHDDTQWKEPMDNKPFQVLRGFSLENSDIISYDPTEFSATGEGIWFPKIRPVDDEDDVPRETSCESDDQKPADKAVKPELHQPFFRPIIPSIYRILPMEVRLEPNMASRIIMDRRTGKIGRIVTAIKQKEGSKWPHKAYYTRFEDGGENEYVPAQHALFLRRVKASYGYE